MGDSEKGNEALGNLKHFLKESKLRWTWKGVVILRELFLAEQTYLEGLFPVGPSLSVGMPGARNVCGSHLGLCYRW